MAQSDILDTLDWMVETLGVGLCRSPGDISIGMGESTLCDSLGTISLPKHSWTSSTDPTDSAVGPSADPSAIADVMKTL